MPFRLKRRPLVILTSVTLAAPLLGGCAGAANKPTSLPADTPIVYTTFDTNGGAGVTAISGRDGKTLWHAAIGHSNWAPLIVGDTLFACVFDPAHPGLNVVAVRMRDGKLLWRTSLPAGDGFNDVFAADATTVAVNADRGGLYALDAATGAKYWQVDTPGGQLFAEFAPTG